MSDVGGEAVRLRAGGRADERIHAYARLGRPSGADGDDTQQRHPLSFAHVDLSHGPATITLPSSGDRYLSLALIDAYTNNFTILGTRTTGANGVTFTLVGPNDAAEEGSIVRSPTRHVCAFARTLVAGPHDLDAARNVMHGGGFIEGWSYPGARLGDFGQDYGYRATVAIRGLGALPPVEAMYMRAGGDLPGALFDGGTSWRLHFPADRLIPVHAFWSLSMYEATMDGQFFFTENPLNRYSIGDRTPGLTMRGEGSLNIWIGHENPGHDRASNWLPAPHGLFALMIRAFLPKPELLEGHYRLPPVFRR